MNSTVVVVAQPDQILICGHGHVRPLCVRNQEIPGARSCDLVRVRACLVDVQDRSLGHRGIPDAHLCHRRGPSGAWVL